MTEEQQQQCDQCGKSGGAGMLRCGGCHAARYCSAACQKAAWPAHKPLCAALRHGAPPSAARVALRAHTGATGSALYAARAFARGEVVFAEAARVSAPMQRLRSLSSGKSSALVKALHETLVGPLWDAAARAGDENPGAATLWALVYMAAAYCDGDAALRAFVDGLALPPFVGAQKAQGFRELAGELTRAPPLARAPRETLYNVLLRVDNNQHLCRDARRVALFEHGCRVAHSCAPNVQFHTTRDAALPVVVYRAVRDVAEGELLTSSYLDDTQLLLPTRRRRELLLAAKGFVCRCARCLRPDRCRSVRCPSCGAEEAMPTGRLSQPFRGDEKPHEREDVAREIASTRMWACQNAACKETFYNAEQPFSSEAGLLERVAAIDARTESREPAAAGRDAPAELLADAEALRSACREILGTRHWAVGQLAYAEMVQLQVVAAQRRSRELHIRAALAARDFAEWAAAAAPECEVAVANAQFFAGRLCEGLDMRDVAMPLYRACLPAFEASWGPDSPDVQRVRKFIGAPEKKV